ncbi:bacterial regulatory s, tetR family protein [Mycobacterium intracellulare]|nr:bacterial regulatory s, tetR family protein [Mycobacterium intracellulare]
MPASRPVAPSAHSAYHRARKRGDDTRAKIIDETVRCIVEEGFSAATAKHVAERAGVTWGVIQYHFGDRNGLLMAVVDDGVARLVDSLSSADVSELPLRDRIEVVVDTAWGCYSSPTSMAAFEILRETRGGPDPSSRRHLLDMNAAIGQLGRLITTEPAHAGVAEVIWATLRGVGAGADGHGHGHRLEPGTACPDRHGHLLPRPPRHVTRRLFDANADGAPACAAMT